ncbi:hypothetical protein IW261DRAFT_930548 [Armillaria novae-zelandiae]|uniref:Uncharacterized protein n=1 Tax=Armillaria novae-zelandiae TaxID=153914 RepID=A0AA39PGI2_9AGAR|nr:hypothetical protein IW261DRAFT_930548 [Armillaria novae-zelandiae]
MCSRVRDECIGNLAKKRDIGSGRTIKECRLERLGRARKQHSSSDESNRWLCELLEFPSTSKAKMLLSQKIGHRLDSRTDRPCQYPSQDPSNLHRSVRVRLPLTSRAGRPRRTRYSWWWRWLITDECDWAARALLALPLAYTRSRNDIVPNCASQNQRTFSVGEQRISAVVQV